MNQLKKIAVCLSLLVVITSVIGCMTYKEVEMVRVTSVGVTQFSTSGIEMDVGIQIKNPNNYDISIEDSDLVLFIKGNKVGNATIVNKVTLPQKSNQVHQLTINSQSNGIDLSLLPILMEVLEGKPTEIEILGDVKAKANGISKSFPVNFKEEVTL